MHNLKLFTSFVKAKYYLGVTFCAYIIVCETAAQALHDQTAEQNAAVFESRMRNSRLASYTDIAAIITLVQSGPWPLPLKECWVCSWCRKFKIAEPFGMVYIYTYIYIYI